MVLERIVRMVRYRTATSSFTQDWWFWVGVSAIVVAIFGGAIARPPVGVFGMLVGLAAIAITLRGGGMSQREKVAWIIVCVILLAAESRSIYRVAAIQQEEQERLQRNFKDILDSQRKQFEATLRENQRQFAETLLATAEVKHLSEESINSVTGGDSFCYIDMFEDRIGSMMVGLRGKGKYAISDLSIRIVDVEQFLRVFGTGRNGNADIDLSFPMPRHYAGFIEEIYRFPIPDRTKVPRVFNMFFQARNGQFTEHLLLRFVNGGWRLAKQVQINLFSGKRGLALEEISKEFPRDELATDKEWTVTHALPRVSVSE